jgi:hypothetical protein
MLTSRSPCPFVSNDHQHWPIILTGWAFLPQRRCCRRLPLAVNSGDNADTTGAIFGQIAGAHNETFEFLVKSAKPSYRRKTVSSNFTIFWIPGRARNDGGAYFSKLSLWK